MGNAANSYAQSVLFSGRPNGVEQAIFRYWNNLALTVSLALLFSVPSTSERLTPYFMTFSIGIMVFPNLRIYSINTGKYRINFNRTRIRRLQLDLTASITTSLIYITCSRSYQKQRDAFSGTINFPINHINISFC